MDGRCLPLETDAELISSTRTEIKGFLMAPKKMVSSPIVENEQRLRLVFEKSRDIILIHGYTEKGLPGPFVDANEFACKKLGYTREELLKLTVSDIVSQDEVGAISETAKCLTDQRNMLFEKTLVNKFGERILVEVNACLFFAQEEKFTISICRDISIRKQREREMERLIEELRKALADVKKTQRLAPYLFQL